MSLIAMDMPESHAELVDWLEEQLVGLHLASLVAELSAIHAGAEDRGEKSDATSLFCLLKERVPEVLGSGLTVLDTQQVRSLLQHPRCLLELQELVLASGEPHWDDRLAETDDREFDDLAEKSWRRMQLAIAPPMEVCEDNADTATSVDTVSGDSATEVAPSPMRLRQASVQPAATPRMRSVWPGILATAALLMLGALGLYQTGVISLNLDPDTPLAQHRPATDQPVGDEPVPPQGWGWERPGAIPSGVAAEIYLNKLAHAGGEWFNKRPVAQAEVSQRIREFRRGCTLLIEAPHAPLAEEDRIWLVEKCTACRDNLAAPLASLDAGDDPLTVRREADQTIERLIQALRTKADEVA